MLNFTFDQTKKTIKMQHVCNAAESKGVLETSLLHCLTFCCFSCAIQGLQESFAFNFLGFWKKVKKIFLEHKEMMFKLARNIDLLIAIKENIFVPKLDFFRKLEAYERKRTTRKHFSNVIVETSRILLWYICAHNIFLSFFLVNC